MATRFTSVVPVLRMFSVEKAREFYLDFLGFTVAFEHRFDDRAPLSLGIERQGLELHLSEHHGDACPGAQVRIETTDLDGFHAEITAKGYGYMRPGIEAPPWGTREMTVTDPFGNRLCFVDRVGSAAG